jgi:uncharacterized membrane protein (DUF4010 family)
MAFLLTFIFGPIKSALAWLFKHPLELIILALAVACAFLYWRNTHLKSDLAVSQAMSARQAQNVATLQAAIATQNAGVERILRQGVANVAAAKARAQAETQAASKVRVIYQTKVERIEAAQVPQECDQAAAWAAGQAGQLVEGWK